MKHSSQTRRDFLKVCGAGAAAVAFRSLLPPSQVTGAQTRRSGANSFAARGKDRPNILFLFTDDQAFSTLNILNNPEVRTPNMDRLVRRGTTFTLGDVTLRVLSPPARPLEKVRSPINANSIVLRLSTEGVRMLFTGDIEAETEEFLLAAGGELTADVLKVPHHGVSTSSTPAFLDAVKPRYAVITCAYYAEPSRELYDRFE